MHILSIQHAGDYVTAIQDYLKKIEKAYATGNAIENTLAAATKEIPSKNLA
ncbi:MAG: hypothetical protein NTZ24_13665 [Deltaproteobacteria bacterium]|nr:hypothetical protein [Deltaproteobacteria bacterium]